MNPAIFEPSESFSDVSLSDTSLSDASFTRRDLLVILFKHKGLILLLWMTISILVAVALVYLPPTYIAEAKVLVKTEQQGRPSLLSGIAAYREALDNDPSNRKIETEMEILLSRPMAEQVVRDLNLRISDVYQAPYAHLLAPVGRFIDWIKTDVMGLPKGPSREFDNTVDALLKSLRVAPGASKSGEATPNIFVVRIQAGKAGVAQEALQRLLVLYQQYSNNLDQRYGERAYAIVEERVNAANALVTQAQTRIKAYAASHPAEAFAATQTPHSSAADTAGDQDGGSPRNPGNNLNANLNASTSGETSAALLRTRITQLELELADQRQLYTDKVESVRALQSTINTLGSKLAQQVAQDTEQASQFGILQRELQMAEDYFFDLKHKLTQIGLFLEMNPEQASSRIVVDPPRLPDSSEWKKSLIVGLAISAAGLLLGLGVASFLEYSDHRFSKPRDVERYTGLPVLAIIDRIDADKLRHLVVAPLKKAAS